MLALKEAEIEEESITIHIKQGQTEKKQMKNKDKTTTVMVHIGNLKKPTTLPLPNMEEWRQYTSQDNDTGYIKSILSSIEETPVYPK